MENYQVSVKKTDALSPTELLTIMQERVRVFVVEQACPYQEIDGQDEMALHVCFWQGSELVAYARVIPHLDGRHISFGRVLVKAPYRGQELGKALIRRTLAEIKNRFPQQEVQIAAQAYLTSFYATFGFTAISSPYLEDGILHIDMVRPS
ncbi:GNAT family N-acetyltransferase [Weissella halotolerans]|uniref:N-acetyltransferase domain-containing protein n=1 Tax=Weissella halotolerans DSM 20190 TaxID=1123500 RepID=A0A0R2G2V0_9LACO|nr:GNAT family N-acetyltransferase [Weissella halotolerans]KRN31674.1 hypothetical protein IV68_GL000928 [Weissella halotolerans DSM 20190]